MGTSFLVPLIAERLCWREWWLRRQGSCGLAVKVGDFFKTD